MAWNMIVRCWRLIRTVCYLSCILAGSCCDNNPAGLVHTETYRFLCRAICEDVNRYQAANGGQVPTIVQLVEKKAPFVQIAQTFDMGPAQLLESFEIIGLPQCIHNAGQRRDSYVLIIKRVPNDISWNRVFLEGKEVPVE